MKNLRRFEYTDIDGDQLNIDHYVKEKAVVLTIMEDTLFSETGAFLLEKDLLEKVIGTLQDCLSKMKGD